MEPLFYYTIFLVSKKPIFYKRWYENKFFIVNYILNEDGSFMDCNTFNLSYGMRTISWNTILMDSWLQSNIGLEKNNILIKICSPYITNNFLYLPNATKSRKLYEILNTNCEEPTGKFR